MINNLEMPQETKGFVTTLNNMGFMTSEMDLFSELFVEEAARSPLPSLDIGAAYGIASINALKKGAKVIANDLDERHLSLLWERTPSYLRKNLTLCQGEVPGKLEVESDSVSAILICRVLHFLEPKKITATLKETFRFLAPGGKLFIVADTPYLKCFEKFVPEFEKEKIAGNPWPGMIDDLSIYAGDRSGNLPKIFHTLDVDILVRELTEVGFEIEKAELFEHLNYPKDLRLDGREGVGVIAVKPVLNS